MNYEMQPHQPQNVGFIAQKQTSGALAEASMGREIQEVQAAMVIAKRFPRDVRTACDRISLSCQRPALASQAIYSYAKGGTDVSGPSIRLAEAIAQSWGNIQYGIKEIENSNGVSTVEAFAWDYETNIRHSKTFQVAHVRYTKKNGVNPVTDPREIYEIVANQGARRLRACLLGVIPADIVEDAVAQCEETLRNTADVTPDGIQKMLAKFTEIEVTKEQIEKFVQRRLEAITAAQVVRLRKIYNSIKDGLSSPADWFEQTAPVSSEPKKVDQIVNPFEKSEKAKAAKAKPEPVQQETETLM
jgi:hypothetical protein